MPVQHSTTVPARLDVFGPLQGAERVVWRGHCAVAEYAFDEAASLPRWTLPETTEVLVTDHRIAYAHTTSDSPDDLEITSGDLKWLWPQHLRVQPGARTQGRAAATAQIQLVCAGPDDTFPALVFAGGDLKTVGDADRLANIIRHAIARFRMDNAEKLGLTTPQARMLSRLLIGPEFINHQGGEGQTVTILGALPVNRPISPSTTFTTPPALVPEGPTDRMPGFESYPAPAAGGASISLSGPDLNPPPRRLPATPPATDDLEPLPKRISRRASLNNDEAPADVPAHLPVPLPEARPVPVAGLTGRLPGYRPGLAADEARALQAAAAEEETQLAQPDLASRAADLAARIANLVSATEENPVLPAPAKAALPPQPPAGQVPAPRQGPVAGQLPAPVRRSAADQFPVSDGPTTDLTARAESVRRAAARFAANSANSKAARRSDREVGSTTRGNRTR
ncbi:MAG: translation initiation factor 2 [Actinoplanes sp.]